MNGWRKRRWRRRRRRWLIEEGEEKVDMSAVKGNFSEGVAVVDDNVGIVFPAQASWPLHLRLLRRQSLAQ